MPTKPDSRIQLAVTAASILVFLYSLVVLRQVLLGTAIALLLVFLYLLWRFVRAVERIADAMEVETMSEEAVEGDGQSGSGTVDS